VWPGELGALVLTNHALSVNPMNEDKGLNEAIEEYVKLQDIWRRSNSPYSKEECPICRPEMVKSGSNDNHGDEDGETDGDGDHGHDDHDNGGDDESDGDDGEDGEDDNDDEGDKAGPSHSITNLTGTRPANLPLSQSVLCLGPLLEICAVQSPGRGTHGGTPRQTS
jgi:hypothetical protein